MNPDLDAALCRDFPHLYAKRNASPQETCMCWGFDCGDGWEPLIRRLSEKLEPMVVAGTCSPAEQVKEKFGTLRFYIGLGSDEAFAAIDEAEAESARTCEDCGAAGVLRKGGWIRTLCDEHAGGREAMDPIRSIRVLG